MPLEHVDIPWVWLREHLDRIIDEVNQNKPLSSSSIAIDVHPNGSLLRTTGPDQGDKKKDQPTPWKFTPDGELAGWHPLISFNPAPTSPTGAPMPPTVFAQWVWGGTPQQGKSYQWVSVGLIDPSTCVQYTLIVLAKP